VPPPPLPKPPPKPKVTINEKLGLSPIGGALEALSAPPPAKKKWQTASGGGGGGGKAKAAKAEAIDPGVDGLESRRGKVDGLAGKVGERKWHTGAPIAFFHDDEMHLCRMFLNRPLALCGTSHG